MFRRLFALVAAATATMLVMTASASSQQVLLGASNPGHSAYGIVVAYSQAVRRLDPSIEISVQPSGGSIEAMQFLQTGRLHAVPVGSSVPYEAYNGLGRWEGRKVEGVRTWLPMYGWGAQLVVPQQSDIQSWADLRGRRVGVGPIGSAGETYNRDILAAIGITYDDIDEYRIPHGEAADGLKTGMLDALIETTGFPTPGVMELMASMNVRIVSSTPEELAKIVESNPLYSEGVIPAGAYPEIGTDIPVVVGYTIMVIDEEVSDDTVYTMTRAIWEHLDIIQASHASQRLLNPSMIQPALEPVAPIHPGALRYYREQGWVE